MEDKRYAVLIDSDNISAKYISAILDEMTKYGVITYRRIYGDWTQPQSGKWKDELLSNSITPIQQFRNTTGKNATDSALIIDAMDILYTDNVDGFCIVSSDSDFTRLASRLRESGMHVIGMGEKKTPKSFRAACSVFTNLELLIEPSDNYSNVNSISPNSVFENVGNGFIDPFNYENQDNRNGNKQGKNNKKAKSAPNVIPQSDIINTIIEIITENDNKGKETGLGEIGSRLQKKYSDFDTRNYGYSSLSTFIDEIDTFDVSKKESTVMVALRNDDSTKNEITSYAVKLVTEAGKNGIYLAHLGKRIHQKYPQFNPKEFGYSTFSKYITSIKSLRVGGGDNHTNVYLN